MGVITGGYLMSCRQPYNDPAYAAPNPDLPAYSLVPGAKQPRPQTIYKQLRCDSPGSEKEYELCQPWRQAEAAYDAACTARWQFWAGLFGVVLLVGTFAATSFAAYFAYRAAEATYAGAKADQDSANTADRTLRVMQNTARIELRARLAALPAGINQLVGMTSVMGHVDLKNVGKIPARNVVLWMDMRFSDGREADFEPPRREDLDATNRVIQPGTAMRQGVGEEQIDVIRYAQKGKYLYIWGVAYYEDGYGCRRSTRFCHRYAAAAYNRGENLLLPADKPYVVISASEARFHTEGNEAD